MDSYPHQDPGQDPPEVPPKGPDKEREGPPEGALNGPNEGQQAPAPPVWAPGAPAPTWGTGYGAHGPYGPYGPYGRMEPPPAPPKRSNPLAVAALIVAVFLSSILGVGLATRFRSGSSASTSAGDSTAVAGSDTSAAGALSSQVQAIVGKVSPGIVDINTVLAYQGGNAAGTGMVLTSSGEVLTNNHVVSGATSIKVTAVTTGRTYTAKIVGTDPADDVAVLQLQGASGLKTIGTADSSKLAVGTGVVALGNAYGAGGTPSVVTGNIVALDQTITAGDAGGGAAEELSGLIETNAALQPGDSGGPLVTADGKVVGMDTAASANYRFQAANGVSFAIPINTALSVARQIESGTAPNGGTIGNGAFLGVSVDRTLTGGAVVAAVPAGGTPARTAGIVAGDTITSVDSKTINSASDLTSALAGHKPGDKVTVGWDDAMGQHHTAVVALAAAPAN